MRIGYTPEQEELRRELRSYFTKLMTPERAEALASDEGEMGRGDVYRETVAQMGKDGWLALSWPEEFGGQARPPMDALIFNDEAAIANVPVPFLTINSVAPTIMAFGTEEQKNFFLPRIGSGNLHFSIGYSEPGAGTDLAALRTAAVRDGVLEQVAVLVALGRQLAAVPYLEPWCSASARLPSSVPPVCRRSGPYLRSTVRRLSRLRSTPRRARAQCRRPRATEDSGSPARVRRWATDRSPTRS